MDYLDILEKTPAERIPADRWCIDFTNRLADGETITAATVMVTDLTAGTDVSSSLTSGSAQINSAIVGIAYRGGTEGHNYESKTQVTTSAGGVFEEFFAFRVTTP